MNPDDLLKHGNEIVKAGAIVAGAIPFTGIVKRMLGPAADEVAERVRDEIRLYRFNRQLKLLQKAEKMAAEAGFTPRAVPMKLLFPLLEGASLEDSDELHDLWAGLLTNASNSSTAELVRPSFVEVLKTLTTDTARLLDTAYSKAAKQTQRKTLLSSEIASNPPDPVRVLVRIRPISLVDLGTYSDVYDLFVNAGCVSPASPDALTDVAAFKAGVRQDVIDRQRFAVAMDDLHRLHMWSITSSGSSGERYHLTPSAVQFVTVCRSPSAEQI